jgi:signal peptidase I
VDRHQDRPVSKPAVAPSVGRAGAVWAGFLSLVLPGLGQIYAGHWWLGVLLYLVLWVSTGLTFAATWLFKPTPPAVATLAVGAALLVALRLGAAIDAALRTRGRRVASSRPVYKSTWIAALVMVGLQLVMSSEVIGRPLSGWRSFSMASASEMPTLMRGDHVVADVRQVKVPDYGDVIVFRHPRDPKAEHVKRVIGLPGDRVQIRAGVVILNGDAMQRTPEGHPILFSSAPRVSGYKQFRETLHNGRSYAVLRRADKPPQTTAEYVVPPGHLFVLGDNRDDSMDSRLTAQFGYVPAENVIGIVHTVYWPSDPMRFLARVQ